MDQPTHPVVGAIRRRLPTPHPAAVAVCALVAFAWLAAVPVLGSGHAWDRPLQDAVHRLWSEPATDLFVVVARVGGGPGLGVLAAIAALVLAVRGRRRPAVILVVGLLWSELLNVTLKFAFQRPRPELWDPPLAAVGWSFPSGHAMTSSTLAVLVVALVWHTRHRALAVAVAVPCVLLVGVCRVYLGVHYPSDILAGWCVTAAWTAAALAVARQRGVSVAEDAVATR